MRARLIPTFTLQHLYGPRRAYAPRAHPDTCGWISRDRAILDALTGNQLSVAGAMPVACSAGALSPAGLELLEEAGLEITPNVSPFHNEAGAVDVARSLAGGGVKVVLQHAYPPGVLAADAWWVPPAVVAYLNNKANLGELVPDGHAPARRVTTWAALRSAPSPALPVVVKTATDDSTGAGTAVAVCRTHDELTAAFDRLSLCERVVVEEFLRIEQNLCLHYAVLPDGSSQYIGFAEQHTNDAGRYLGNWIEPAARLPASVVDVGLEVARRGAALGFRGVAGFDVAIVAGGRPVVLDLNFRVNGSTPAVLLAPAVADAHGPRVMHLRGLVGRDGFNALLATARAATRRGRIVPLSAFDPTAAGHAGQPARIGAVLVMGKSKEDVLAAEAELLADGMA